MDDQPKPPHSLAGVERKLLNNTKEMKESGLSMELKILRRGLGVSLSCPAQAQDGGAPRPSEDELLLLVELQAVPNFVAPQNYCLFLHCAQAFNCRPRLL